MVHSRDDNVQKPSELSVYSMNNLEINADNMQYAGNDRVLPIIEGEQDLICEFLRPKAGERVIDAGTGSGVIALFASAAGCEVSGVDVLDRAIRVAELNAKRNALNVRWVCGRYETGTFPKWCADLVVFNPPHHPTPETFSVAVHANGGIDGLKVFDEFFDAAMVHVRPGGRIVFFQLSIGQSGNPEVVRRIAQRSNCSCRIQFSRVLPTIPTEWFLDEIYGHSYRQWAESLQGAYPELDLILGDVTIAQEQTEIVELSHTWDQSPVDAWASRITLHREIVRHGHPRPSREGREIG